MADLRLRGPEVVMHALAGDGGECLLRDEARATGGQHGHDIVVQAGAGDGSAISDEDYRSQGARILPDADAVFGVRPSLVGDFVRQPAGTAPDGRAMAQPYYTLDYDFVMVPPRA